MDRLNLKRLGLVHSQEDDFSDDGNRFIGYRHADMPKLRVSKLIDDGELYLHANIEGSLDYDEYKELPHREVTDRLNGTTLRDLTEEDLTKWMEDLKSYYQEYIEMEPKVEQPNEEVIREYLNQELEQAVKDIDTVKELMDKYFYMAIQKCSPLEHYFKEALNYIHNMYQELEYKKSHYNEQLNIYLKDRIAYMNMKKYHYNKVEPNWHIKYIREDFEKIANKN